MSEERASKTVRLMIYGRVQNVFYRATARTEAERRGLAGWVRNRRGGEVEAVVSGRTKEVDSFIRWTRQGPAAARVERVEILDAGAPDGPGFTVKPDA